MDEIETLLELVQAVRDSRTGGYEVDFDIKTNMERSRTGEGFFLVVDVKSSEPNPETPLNGEWWFCDDGQVMQVL